MARHREQLALELRRQAREAGWGRHRLIDEIVRACDVSPLRAHRMAEGRTLKETAEQLRELYGRRFGEVPPLSHQQVSKWEIGADSPSKYLDVLCELYATRPDRLGIGRDYGGDHGHDHDHDHDHDHGGDDSDGLPEEPPVRPTVNRRHVLFQVGLAATQSVVADLDSTRLKTEDLLQRVPVSHNMIANMKNDVREYGYTIRTTDPHVFLRQAKLSFSTMHRMFEQRQSAETHRQLCSLMAKMSGLIAIDINALGDAQAAHAWFRLAGDLARENGNPLIRSWITAYEAMSHLWHGRRAARALELAGEARHVAGEIPSTSAALAAAIEARAYARLNRARQAMKSLDDAESLWSRLESGLGEDESTFGFYEQLLRMYQSDVLTVLGENLPDAYAAQDRAVALAPRGTGLDVDTALVLLDRATCLAKQGEMTEAGRVALRTMLRMPESFRAGTAAQRARGVIELATAVGAAKLVAELEDLLREAANRPH